jgi:hypothetical protein
MVKNLQSISDWKQVDVHHDTTKIPYALGDWEMSALSFRRQTEDGLYFYVRMRSDYDEDRELRLEVGPFPSEDVSGVNTSFEAFYAHFPGRSAPRVTFLEFLRTEDRV